MSNLLYVLVPIAAVVVIGLLIALIERKPKSPTSSIDNFSARMAVISNLKSTVQDHNADERKQAV